MEKNKNYLRFYFHFILLCLIITSSTVFSAEKLLILPSYNSTKDIQLDKINQTYIKYISSLLSEKSEIQTVKSINDNPIKDFDPSNSEYLLTLSEKYKVDWILCSYYELVADNEIRFNYDLFSVKNEGFINKENIILLLDKKKDIITKLQLIKKKIWGYIININFQIETSPSQSDVYINDIWIGKTPLKHLTGTTGYYRIKIIKRGHNTLYSAITLNKDKDGKNKYYYQLVPLSPTRTVSFGFKYQYSFQNDSKNKTLPFLPLAFSIDFYYKYLALEFEVGTLNYNRETKYEIYKDKYLTESRNWDILTIASIAKVNLFRLDKFSPYAGMGGGVGFVHVSEDKTEHAHSYLKAVIGLHYNFASDLFFKVEGSYFYIGKTNIYHPIFNPYGKKHSYLSEMHIEGYLASCGFGFYFN